MISVVILVKQGLPSVSGLQILMDIMNIVQSISAVYM